MQEQSYAEILVYWVSGKVTSAYCVYKIYPFITIYICISCFRVVFKFRIDVNFDHLII